MFPVSKLELGNLYVAITGNTPDNNLAFNHDDYYTQDAIDETIWMPEIGEVITFFDGVCKSGIKGVILAVPTDALGIVTILLLQRKHIVRAEFTEIMPALIVKTKSDVVTMRVNTNYQFVAHDINQVLQVVVSRYKLGADVRECGEFIKDAMHGLNRCQTVEIVKHTSDDDNYVLKEIMAKYDALMLVDELNKDHNFSSQLR